jgi:hypothetical protein
MGLTCKEAHGRANLARLLSSHGVTPQQSLPPCRRKLTHDCRRWRRRVSRVGFRPRKATYLP